MSTLALDCGELFWIPTVARAVVDPPSAPARPATRGERRIVSRDVPVIAPLIAPEPLIPDPDLDADMILDQDAERWDGLG